MGMVPDAFPGIVFQPDGAGGFSAARYLVVEDARVLDDVPADLRRRAFPPRDRSFYAVTACRNDVSEASWADGVLARAREAGYTYDGTPVVARFLHLMTGDDGPTYRLEFWVPIGGA